ncbi:MAG: hypothetical protein ACOCX3_02425 [Chloroflexota bacterium]
MGKNDPLKPDPDAQAEWDKLPKSMPSRDALPPLAGGFPRWLWWLIGLASIIGLVALIAQAAA